MDDTFANGTSSSYSWKHDVFMSLGSGICSNFSDHLYAALTKTGIDIFQDDEVRSPGQEIGPATQKTISVSRISIIIFSSCYVSSRCCLNLLETILDCRKKRNMIVLPIFYDVDPSDIRKQKGCVGTALAQHKEHLGDLRVKRWKAALKEASNLCGWDFRNDNGKESEFICQVVEDILNKKTSAHLNISIYPIGYDTCEEYLNLFLQAGSDDVIIAGICGATGMGKTAIARAIYDRISHNFEGSCFLTGVGGYSKNHNGLPQLQEKLLFDTLPEKVLKVTNFAKGVDMIRENLCRKRVLVVLDDVDHLDQLFALVGERNWFGAGSKVILTTRNVQLLNVFEVDEIFMAQGLPPSPNVKVIWEQFRQSRRTTAGLVEYIKNFQHLTNEKVRYLEDCLLKEKQKNAFQAQIILDLEQVQSKGSTSTGCTIVEDTVMHRYDANCGWINSNNEAECEETKFGGSFSYPDMDNENNLPYNLESGESTEPKGETRPCKKGFIM